MQWPRSQLQELAALTAKPRQPQAGQPQLQPLDQGVGPQSQTAATSQGQAQDTAAVQSQLKAEVSMTLVAAIRGKLMTLHQIV